MTGQSKRPTALRTCLLALLLTVITAFPGCRVLDVFSVDSLLRAPKLTGENARIQSSFERAVGKDVQLVSPLTGVHRSAFVFFDYDSDGTDETLVFYAGADAPDEIHMHFMDYNGSDWYSVGDVTGNGSEVYNVEFENIDGDAYREILVSWTVSDSKRIKTFTVYKYNGGRSDASAFTQLTALQIYDYLALDLDSDGSSEILYLSSDAAAQPQVIRASVIKMDSAEHSFVPVSEVEFSHSVEFPLSCLHDVLNGQQRIYYDCLNFDDSYMTEILLYDKANAALVRPQDENGEYLCQQTYRSEELYCRQNGSSPATVPIRSLYEGAKIRDTENEAESDLYVLAYMELRGGEFRPADGKYLYLPAEGCRISVDDFMDDYIAEYRVAERELRFSPRSAPEALSFSYRFYQTHGENGGSLNYRTYISAAAKNQRITEASLASAIEVL